MIMPRVKLLGGTAYTVCAVMLAIATPAVAAEAPPATNDAPPDRPADAPIVVTARRLDEARSAIQKSLGADSYGISAAAIQALPGGDNQQFNQIMLQLPGVVQDGFGQFHVRDDHANLQYRINGTILPEGLAVFGQTLSPRLIDHFDLLTGALPAQYGLRTAGVIDIHTKSGFANGGQISLYGGSHDTFEPSVEYGGSNGTTNYFVSADYRHDALGIENVTSARTALHDATDQFQGFAYVDHILSANDRISFVGGYSNQWFQIPNPPGLIATSPVAVDGQTTFASDRLNETQLERTGFGQLAFLHDNGPLTVQIGAFARYSALLYRPDAVGELIFNGQAQAAVKTDLALGLQGDASWRVGGGHTLRFGGFVQHDNTRSNTTTAVFPVDGGGVANGPPLTIGDRSTKNAVMLSAYVQDEWQLSGKVTLNYGARFDYYDAYRHENQLSPRANLVWQPGALTTLHLGYSRYFSPPPFELVANGTIARFVGTSAAANSLVNTTPRAERQHYFDIGMQQKLAPGFTVGIDGYYRLSRHMVDEGQFGAPIILTPFNYAFGRVRGVNLYGNYQRGAWLLYANFAVAKAQGRQIESSEFSFSADDLAYIASHYIYVDHDQTYTGSAGASYSFKDGALTGLKLGASMIYGSGLRSDLVLADGTTIPNGAHLPAYAQVNLAASYKWEKAGVEVRFDVTNAFDAKYQIRDGTGIGVGAPQWGPRRGFFFGISKDL
ncbi:TonB-dependent receptor [Novosphingobium sp.]|uniref:TonB-dependent receptor n=1 Tax=Novosphingobium sp. TaxID=1874826 RepID=UPI00333F5685